MTARAVPTDAYRPAAEAPRAASRRRLLQATAAFALAAAGVGTGAVQAQRLTLKVGDQRGNARAVMEAAGVLEGLPYDLVWSEFPNAAPLLEALRAGAIDAGSVGDAPLTFAAANGLKAKAIFATRYEGNAVIVPGASPAQRAADLRGKRIGVVKGSSGHKLLLQVLKEAGVPVDAVTLAFLAPSESTLALQQGSVDAVVSWEPYVSFATLKSGARILVDGKAYPALSYFVASDEAIAAKEAALRDFVARNAQARRWAQDHVAPYSRTIAKLVNIPEDVALNKQAREGHAPVALDAAIQQLQQETIDLYASSGLIAARYDAATLLDARLQP